MADIKEYSEDKQKLLVNVLLSSSEIFARCQNILSADYFVNKVLPETHLLWTRIEAGSKSVMDLPVDKF